MTKTIEEAAREYAEAMCPIGDYCGGVYDEQRNSDLPIYTDDAKSVLEWFFTKPLSQRLRDEEREKVKGLHYHLTSVLAYCHPSADNIVEATIHDIESIFGKELFGEG